MLVAIFGCNIHNRDSQLVDVFAGVGRYGSLISKQLSVTGFWPMPPCQLPWPGYHHFSSLAANVRLSGTIGTWEAEDISIDL